MTTLAGTPAFGYLDAATAARSWAAEPAAARLASSTAALHESVL
ncbi:MAG TPA: hypothetical protein VJ617_21045 [Arthrobacter sp.]|nr:hypothetical protein [Arthrobacter sp.]